MLHAVRVLAVAAVLGAARRLDVGGFPRLGADGAQEGGGMAGAGADFHVVGLQQGAALLVPVLLQAQDDFLKAWVYCWSSSDALGKAEDLEFY